MHTPKAPEKNSQAPPSCLEIRSVEYFMILFFKVLNDACRKTVCNGCETDTR